MSTTKPPPPEDRPLPDEKPAEPEPRRKQEPGSGREALAPRDPDKPEPRPAEPPPPGNRSDPPGRNRTRLRHILILAVALLIVSAGSALAYFRLFPEPRPSTLNGGNAIAQISFPVDVYELGFVVHVDTTTISVSFTPTPITSEPITITYLTGDRPQLTAIDTGVIRDGNPRPDAWTLVAVSDTAVQLRPKLISEEISTIELTFTGNQVIDIAERRHIRTAAWTVEAPEIRYSELRMSPSGVGAQPQPGQLEIQTSGYNVEKVESTGRIGNQTLLGNFTSYSVSPDLNLIPVQSTATIPATNLDMVDLQKVRDREANSLMIGALLGVAGALLVEVLLASIAILERHS